MVEASHVRCVGTLVVLGTVLVLSLASPALAQTSTTRSTDDQFQICADQQVDPLSPRDCIFDENGNLVSVEDRSTGPDFSIFGILLVVAIAWSLVPFALAVVLAHSRGESIGGAVLLTLVLGWAGLAIVYFGQRRTLAAARSVLDDPHPIPGETNPPAH